MKPTFYEFFAGGGMARAGLEPGWRCVFANDVDPRKAAAYRANWGDDGFRLGDIHRLGAADLPGVADLAWASFPCQDLSLAGAGRGLSAGRSGAFWGLWSLVDALASHGRAPRSLVLENVVGLLTSTGGEDFRLLCAALRRLGYRYGALAIDAASFVPQSRPRLFVVATLEGRAAGLAADGPEPFWTSDALGRAHAALPDDVRRDWLWWRLPAPPVRRARFADLLVEDPPDAPWRSPAQTGALLAMMSRTNRAKIAAAQSAGRRMVGTIYRRTRLDETGRKVQRAEVRFDDVAGCLRTPAGGSSRQTVIVVEGERVRTRLLSAREGARLMGLPDSYRLPARYSEAYHLVGDGIVAPVVRHLSDHLLTPLARGEPGRVAA